LQAAPGKLPRGIANHVAPVLHDDVHCGTDGKRDKGRYTERSYILLTFVSNVMKHGRRRYPRHTKTDSSENI
jgi:hypothetical protein